MTIRTAHECSLLLAGLVLSVAACGERTPGEMTGVRRAPFVEADDERGRASMFVAPVAALTPNTDRQFVWPVSGWVGATNTYYSGSAHLGSADIGVNIGTPIMAARAGTVVDVGWIEMPRSGWVVKISHGNGIVTKYSHMIRRPKVARGTVVPAGAILGYSGRTGRAPYPHVHFAIEFWTDAAGRKCDALACVHSISYAVIGGLIRGAWVTRGRYIPGEFGLSSTPAVTNATSPSNTYRVRVTESNLRPYGSSALGGSPSAAALTRGPTYTVYDEANGALRIDAAAPKWVARSGTVPAPAEPDWVEPTLRKISGTQPVRTAPSASAQTITTLAAGTIVRVVGADAATGWYRALVRNAVKDLNEFGYLDSATAVSRPTSDFEMRGIMDGRGATLRDGPDAQYAAGPTLAPNVNLNSRTVRLYTGTIHMGTYRVFNGWFQIARDQWVPGWKASPPQ